MGIHVVPQLDQEPSPSCGYQKPPLETCRNSYILSLPFLKCPSDFYSFLILKFAYLLDQPLAWCLRQLDPMWLTIQFKS